MLTNKKIHVNVQVQWMWIFHQQLSCQLTHLAFISRPGRFR